METKLANLRWEDIVFEHRNHAYGAYRLRKTYSQRVLLGSGTTIALVASLLLLLECSGDGIDRIITPPTKPGGHKFTEVIIREREKKDPEKRPQKEEKSKKANTTVQVVTHAVDSSIVVDSAANAIPALPIDFYGNGLVGEGVDGDGDAPVPSTPVKKKVVDRAEVMPEYEGGFEALYKFISKHVRYPKAPRNLGIEGTVYVSFVVDGNGKVRDVKVIRGIHRDCDAEAARVIGMLSKWKGGSQNGFPVDVRMVLPIRFQLH